MPVRELVAVKRFGEPAFPALEPLGTVTRSDDRPFHTLINGENYHALQLLRYLYGGKIDCIYIDPPYNTGASDWKYNNRYVDGTDRWRHSKWLSFMEKRLTVAKELLKPDGVLIVTIDEHEIIISVFSWNRSSPVTSTTPSASSSTPRAPEKLNFSRIAEYAIFCVPDNGRTSSPACRPTRQTCSPASARARARSKATSKVSSMERMTGRTRTAKRSSRTGSTCRSLREELPRWELRHARRRGGESSYRHQRQNQFYPIFVDADAGKIVGVGLAPPLDEGPDFSDVDGLVPVWPIDAEGNERCWRYVPASMQKLIDQGRLALGRPNKEGTSWTINYWTPRVERKKYKNVWWSSQHDAGTHGHDAAQVPRTAQRLPLSQVGLCRP